MLNKRILAQIAPQRSTQYAALATHLAAPELQLAPLSSRILECQHRTIGAESYLLLTFAEPLGEGALPVLSQLAATTAYFEFFDAFGSEPGPFLRPIPTSFAPTIPPTLISARRYRGKTNELLTHFLCNIARFSSSFAATPWADLNLLDPLAGGGTIPFTGLVLGANVAGIDQSTSDIKSAATFLQNFLRETNIPYRTQEERLRKIGRRWRFTLGARGQPHQFCLLSSADSLQTQQVLDGFKPHVIVTDLPYGVQHHGTIVALLTGALPIWSAILRPGGTLAFAWDATRFARADMIDLVESTCNLNICTEAPYDALEHRVDRVIKQRDILVATKS